MNRENGKQMRFQNVTCLIECMIAIKVYKIMLQYY